MIRVAKKTATLKIKFEIAINAISYAMNNFISFRFNSKIYTIRYILAYARTKLLVGYQI